MFRTKRRKWKRYWLILSGACQSQHLFGRRASAGGDDTIDGLSITGGETIIVIDT
jgi:hypothetical protein